MRPNNPRKPHKTSRKRDGQSRFYRQAGISLIVGSLVLGVGFFTATTVFSQFQNSPVDIVAEAAAASTTPASGPNAYARVSIQAKAAVVYDLTTGQTLYAQDANAQLPLASITKLLTLYAASDVLQPNSPVTMTAAAVNQNGDAADYGFAQGETFNFQDLARLTLAASSNSGAEAIAEAADDQRAVDTTSLLASAATAAGLSQTYAVNPTGLDVNTQVSGGYGSAHDIAVLAGALVKKEPLIADATTLPSISVDSLDGKAHTFANTDPDVTTFPNLLLSKTGYTDLAGGNLVIVFDAGINHPVAIVVLGSTESGRFTDMQTLMKATLAHFGGTMPADAHASAANSTT